MTWTRWAAVLVVTLAASIGLAAQSAQELYQRALVREHADGNLPQALELYAQAVKQAGADRALAAKALRHMAAMQEKLWRQAEAASSYAELIRAYPEQRDEIAVAQARLSALRQPVAGAAVATATSNADASARVRAVVDTYCITCHSTRRKSGGLDLETASRDGIGRHTELWENVARRLQARREPPMGAARPDEATYTATIASLEQALDAAYPANRPLAPAERVSDSELASRLAALLWNAAPDAVLLDAARAGDLREPAALQRQVARMLRDPRSSALVEGFFVPWLSLNRVRNTTLYPRIDRDLLEAMDTESRLFLQSQLREDHDALEVWTANYSYVNEQLARHYGLSGVTGREFRRVTWPNASRGGLLGQAATLTALSGPTRTSPTKRGVFLLTRFLGIEAPDPPANIPPLQEQPASPSVTIRARITAHRTSPSCANCHSMFDPLGFGLENFDATGAWRALDAGVPIDASGVFPDGTRFDGPAELRAGLLKYRKAYYTSVTQQLLGHALHRTGQRARVYDYEMAVVRRVLRDASVHGYRWSYILAGIAASAPFQMKHVVP